MKLERFYFITEAELTFSKEDVALLLGLSERHYDYRCKEAGKVGGFLYGLSNAVAHHSSVTQLLKFSEIEILIKITGLTQDYQDVGKRAREMYIQLSKLLRLLNEVSRRVNTEAP